MSSPPVRPEGLSGLVTVEVPVGGRVLVVSGLHLARTTTTGHRLALAELTQTIESWSGPGVVLFNGNTFDADPALSGIAGTSASVLAFHPHLSAAVKRFAAGTGRRVVVLPGDRDIHLAWSASDRTALADLIGAEFSLAADLRIGTGAGSRTVRVDPGQRLDPVSEYRDPSNPRESPLSQHLRSELIPAVRRGQGDGRRHDWLSGMEDLDDPAAFPRFVASRLVYRKLGRQAWLLLVPVALAVVFHLPALVIDHAGGLGRSGSSRLLLLVIVSVAELVLVAGLAVVAVRRIWVALAGISGGLTEGDGRRRAEREPNRAARDLARHLIGEEYHGLITGHTCRPELSDLGTGFYANSGCGAEVVTEAPARLRGLGLPPVFLSNRQISWVELEAGNELHVRLVHALQPAAGATLLERAVVRRGAATTPGKDLRPRVVASFPRGESWPPEPSGQLHKRRVRRLAGLFVAAAGFISLLSSLSEPLRDRLHEVQRIVPIVVPETAAALTALAGVALLVLARSVRRGQHRAWAVTVALLLAVAVLHLIKGLDVEEAAVALAVAGFLWVNRFEFRGATETPRLRGNLVVWALVTAATVAAGTAAIEVSVAIAHMTRPTALRRRPRFSISWWHALEATVGRMTGDTSSVSLPHHIERFFAPAMAAATFGLIVALVAGISWPFWTRRRAGRTGADSLVRARAIFARHGSGTLDYFALRPDKDFWFWGDTVVAYAVYGSACLVSPDPIGPITEREPAWRAFRAFVDSHGWALGGLGVGEEWLPIYRATGMHDLYVGDEGVIRTDRFTLQGGQFKGLRQAVNRVAKYGYTISFHDPSQLDPGLRDALVQLMSKSRRGDVERGFSMTLGRVFEPDDAGLLLAVVHGPSPDGAPGGPTGPPVAFCQYVPAPGINGYSLDLMRRDDGEHPNGLIDFAVVETIKYVRERSGGGLGLNFATMRAVLAGETGNGPTQRAQAWLLRHMGGSMQIESLWKFNAKYDPDWQPRYALYDAPENAFAVAVAVARAESFWELPVVGRLLVPPG